MISCKKILTSANIVINWLYPKIIFLCLSWKSISVLKVSEYISIKYEGLQIMDCPRMWKNTDLDNRFITILANVITFWQESIRDGLPLFILWICLALNTIHPGQSTQKMQAGLIQYWSYSLIIIAVHNVLSSDSQIVMCLFLKGQEYIYRRVVN